MIEFFFTWLLTATALLITAYVVPGIEIADIQTALVATVILGIANAVVKPLLVFFTLPFTILTLGGFLLVVNGITLGLVGYFTPGVTIHGFLPAIIGSIVLSFVSGYLNRPFKKDY